MKHTRLIIWLVAAVLFVSFFFWYTSFKGPMTEAEISAVLEQVKRNGSTEDQIAAIETFMRTDTGDDFIMVNLMELNDNPPELPATGPGASSSELIDHYMEHMYVEQLKRACHPVFFGRAVSTAMDLSGIEGAQAWSQAALFRYRSRRDVMEIAMDPKFSERHDYKMAALTKTIAVPVEPILQMDLRAIVALCLFSLASVLDLLLYRRQK